jgi:hypothetical protein
MKLIKALQEITTSVENAFLTAGMVDGLSLGEEDIKNATEPIFWFVYVKSSIASEKQYYIVWNYQLINSEYGDGEKLMFPFEVAITFYSRNKMVDIYVEKIENAFLENHYIFEFGSVDYDTNRMMYSYKFVVKAMVG